MTKAMTNISERAAYIRGLADGLGVDGKTPEQRVIREILALLEDVGSEADKQQKQFAALASQLQSLRADMEEIQNDLYEDFEEELDSPESLGMALGVIPSNPGSQEQVLHYVHCPRCGEVFSEPHGDKDRPSCPHCGHSFQ